MTSTALPEKAQQILDGRAPDKMRMGIAAGAIPMPPVELVSCLAVIAARDSNAEIKAKAQATLLDLPPHVRKAALEAELADPIFRVLTKFAEFDKSEREALVLNAAAPDDVITTIAARESDAGILGIIAENQTRMLRHVELVEALMENPSLGPAMRARVEEFFSRAYAGKVMIQQGLATRDDLADDDWDDELLDAVDSAASEADDEDNSFMDEFVNEDESEVEDSEEAARMLESAAGEGDAEAEEEELNMANLRKAVQKMTVPQKIKLALMGGKEARMLLVSDGNKVVSSMVLKNNRITDKEILAIAASKTVREDMLRTIARDRKFMKSYGVKVALVENPKSPISVSMQLLPQMRDNDLKRIAKSKGVSTNIANQAKRMVKKKEASR